MAKPLVKKSTKGSVATTTAKSSISKALRPSRIAKHTKKLERMRATGLKASSISYAVTVVALNAPCELAGVVMSMDSNAIVMHCQKPGSSKEQVRIIPRGDLIEITGGEGMPSVVRFFGQKVLTEIKSAQVSASNGVFNITDMTTGDKSTVIASDRINVSVVGSAENVFASGKTTEKKKKFK